MTAPVELTSSSLNPARFPGPRSAVFGFDLYRESKADFLGHIDRLKAEFGDMVMSQVVHEKIVDVHHPELIRELLVENADALIRWERGIAVFANIHGQSVLVTEGQTWKRQRRMLQPGFSTKRMAGYCALMCCATETALAALPPDAVIEMDFERWTKRVTMDVIMQALFSRDGATSADASMPDRAISAVATLSRVGMAEMFWPISAPDWMPHKAPKRRAKQLLDTLIRSNIRLRREQLQAGQTASADVLDMLMSVRDEVLEESNPAGLTDEEIRDQCMTIFLAGHETTAVALTWWAWLMAEHPALMQRAQAQVDSALAGQPPSFENVAQLPFVAASLKEALRLYPPASSLIARRVLRAIKLQEWTIPKGAMVRITPWAVQRDARWFTEPTRFNPERFDSDAPQGNQHNRHSYMPFGTGPRVCIGSQFALTEMTLIAAYLLQRFSFKALAQPKPTLDVLLVPAGGMPLQLIRRTV